MHARQVFCLGATPPTQPPCFDGAGNAKYTLEEEVLVGIFQTTWQSLPFLLCITLCAQLKLGFDGIVGGAGCQVSPSIGSHVLFLSLFLLA